MLQLEPGKPQDSLHFLLSMLTPSENQTLLSDLKNHYTATNDFQEPWLVVIGSTFMFKQKGKEAQASNSLTLPHRQKATSKCQAARALLPTDDSPPQSQGSLFSQMVFAT